MEVIFCQYKSYSISKSTVWQEWQSASINHVLPIDVIFCQYKWYFANKSYILQSCSVEIRSLTVNFVLFCRSALLCRFNIPSGIAGFRIPALQPVVVSCTDNIQKYRFLNHSCTCRLGPLYCSKNTEKLTRSAHSDETEANEWMSDPWYRTVWLIQSVT